MSSEGNRVLPPSSPQSYSELISDVHASLSQAGSAFSTLRLAVEDSLDHGVSDDDFVGQSVQTMLLLRRFDEVEAGRLSSAGPLRNWLLQQRSLDWQTLLSVYDDWRESAIDFPLTGSSSAGDWHDYGPFLAEIDPSRRNKRGVFYTPPEVARFIVAEVDRCLREEWGGAEGIGLFGELGRGWTLSDPAVGSAVFLCAVIEQLAEQFRSANGDFAIGDAEFTEWMRTALGQMQGRDVLLPACVLAHLRIVVELQRVGYDLENVAQIDVRLANSLAQPNHSETVSSRMPTTKLIIVGNPPFSGISQNRNDWIDSLMRDPRRGYYCVDGERLRERKLWLSDDYVKFFRAAQDRIERAGEGILGFVTNQAMIDNATFRGMRWSLQQTFQRHTIIDLHGNRKRKEVDSNGQLDQNVFEIEQGVAICLMRRRNSNGSRRVEQAPSLVNSTELEHADLYGDRVSKLARLKACASRAAELPCTQFRSSAPHYLLSPLKECERFSLGCSLPDLFPVNSTAPLTARDRVVVAFTETELLDRMERFRDLTTSDEAIRAELFGRKLDSLQRRGRRQMEYPPGDTRGWRLEDARRSMSQDDNWRSHTRDCLYRPYDHRRVYWSPTMIDWPRPAVSKHLVDGNNLVLISRRLEPPNSKGTFLWACTGLALDGVIRSDNRGSESLYPVLLSADNGLPNIETSWLDALSRRCGLELTSERRGDLTNNVGALDVAEFAYAQLQSPRYVNRFADNLRQEFPRVFLPQDRESFVSLCRIGCQLLAWHLSEQWSTDGFPSLGPAIGMNVDEPEIRSVICAPYPTWENNRVEIAEGDVIASASREVWDFHVGSHQVCYKWLKDRRGRVLSSSERRHYHRMLTAIEATIVLRASIPGDVDEQGIWRI